VMMRRMFYLYIIFSDLFHYNMQRACRTSPTHAIFYHDKKRAST
jgi:hypothetical protein